MADLDDFFAKKDRKKSKTTKKFAATAEELAKQIEDTSARKNESRPVVRKDSSAGLVAQSPAADGSENAADVVEQAPVVEDEWKEFVAEERKDYSGLKIGQLQIVDDEAGDDAAYDGNSNSDGENNADPDRVRTNDPWRKVEDGAEAPAPADLADEPKSAGPTVAAAYVAPGMRFGLAQRKAVRKGVLPDIHDQDYFPVLGAQKPEEMKKKRPEPTGFEAVRHGSRLQRPSEMSSTAPVSIGNRFNSLADS